MGQGSGGSAAWQDTWSIWVESVGSSWRELLETAATLAPTVVGALLLLLLGWLLASVLRRIILRLGARIDRVFQAALEHFGQGRGELRWPISRVLSLTVYWLVILWVLAAVSRLLALPGLADIFTSVLLYLPQPIAWGLALLAAYVASGLAANAITRAAQSAGLSSARMLGRTLRGFMLVVAVLIAATQLGVDVTLASNVVAIATAALLGGAAVAFGIGAVGATGNIIAAHYVRQSYRVGQRVAVESFEGEILEITRSAVILDAEEGRTLVPGRLFQEKASVLVDRDT